MKIICAWKNSALLAAYYATQCYRHKKKPSELLEGYKRKSVTDFSFLQWSNSLPVPNIIIRVIIRKIIAEKVHVRAVFELVLQV